MIELPLLSLDLLRSMVQNFAIIAALILLYYFIPDSIRSRSQLAYSFSVALVFGVTAVISIPALWQDSGGSVIGFNFILVPLSAVVGGPVSAVFVASVLLAASATSGGSLATSDILTIMSGILLGTLFYSGQSWIRLPERVSTRLLLLGAGIALIEIVVFAFSSMMQPNPGAPFDLSGLLIIIPFIAISCVGTVLLGSIIWSIDRKKQAERELREHKDHLEMLVNERTTELRQANSLRKATFESTADGIVVVDREGYIRAYNRKASRMLDLPLQPPKEVPGTEVFTDHISPLLEDTAGLISQITPLPESAEQIVAATLRFKNGRIYELFVHPQRIGDQIIGRVYSLHDITDQCLAEDAITAANNKLMLLSTLTRHDIFNQMTALAAYLDLLEMDNRDPRAAAHISAMKKSLEVIRFQLEFTRDYQDLGLKKPEWQELETTVARAAESYAKESISIRCDTGPVEIFADPMIGQVFYNLIDNSLRHGGEKITGIRLSVLKDGPDLLMVYEDDGNGVLPEEKEKIFLKGFGKHTGLGMFLIKEILAITGITIRENGVQGNGVRFEIRVPAGKFRFP
ncbi:MAG: ATP-binding protein [Methanoregula sp.]